MFLISKEKKRKEKKKKEKKATLLPRVVLIAADQPANKALLPAFRFSFFFPAFLLVLVARLFTNVNNNAQRTQQDLSATIHRWHAALTVLATRKAIVPGRLKKKKKKKKKKKTQKHFGGESSKHNKQQADTVVVIRRSTKGWLVHHTRC